VIGPEQVPRFRAEERARGVTAGIQIDAVFGGEPIRGEPAESPAELAVELQRPIGRGADLERDPVGLSGPRDLPLRRLRSASSNGKGPGADVATRTAWTRSRITSAPRTITKICAEACAYRGTAIAVVSRMTEATVSTRAEPFQRRRVDRSRDLRHQRRSDGRGGSRSLVASSRCRSGDR
jgi:hypothetical protein